MCIILTDNKCHTFTNDLKTCPMLKGQLLNGSEAVLIDAKLTLLV